MTDATARQVGALPTSPGVYRFRDERERVIYVGRATDLRHRVASYWGDLAGWRHLRAMVGQIARLEALPCDSVHEATWLERNLLEASKPRWNRVRGGLEVPTYIRLVRTPAAARLEVVHSPATGEGAVTFGPFLGGTRARLAVDGLDRVLGLAYAGDRLGGFDRDMARVRGVRAADREERTALAVAVLAGDATALGQVTDLLAARRTEAAAALAFEVAARIQAEIAALAWVTAEQKVTVDGGPDAVAAGWADGVLVRLEVRAGRLDRWQERAASEAVATRAVASTPPAWVAFADRAARQAAALRRAIG